MGLKRRIAWLFVVVWLFIYIFQLPLIRIPMLYISNFITLMYVLLYSRYIKLNRQIISIVKGFLPFFIYFIFQMTLITLSNGTKEAYAENVRYVIMYTVALIIAVSFIVTLINKRGFLRDEVLKAIICVGCIQFICVVLSLLFPFVKEFFNSFIIRNSRSEAVVYSTIAFSGYRSYGFADNLFDQFGYIISLLIIIVYAYGLFEKKKVYIIFSIAFLVMPLVNARSGLLLSLIGICMASIYYIFVNGFKKIYKIIAIIILFLLILPVLLNNVSIDTLQWFSDGAKELIAFIFHGDKSGRTINQLFNEDLIWPSDMLFGAGGSPNSMGQSGIDVGYVRLVWMFGVIGTILLFYGYAKMFYITFKNTNSSAGKAIILSMFVVFFVYLFKLFPIYVPGANMLLFGIPILFTLTSNNDEEI